MKPKSIFPSVILVPIIIILALLGGKIIGTASGRIAFPPSIQSLLK